ncbi:MAG: carboxypeptidase regulatory-like domain-containing protein [Saprospiraceae bacterium]|nr:carboxypeptidase regulatory-like domain-containing protein [Saprospiraceae bacterium]
MNYQPVISLFLFCLFAFGAQGSPMCDSLPQPMKSRILAFSETEGPDSGKAVLNLYLHDDYDETVLGATALLQRANPSQVHGRISQWDGRCQFKVLPGTYEMRIQLTGMASFEQENVELQAGRQYEMEIELIRMSPPVPSAKSQAGNNRRR